MVLDVDHFKLYNDTFGHPAGDAALQSVAAVLQAHAPRATDMAARYGGEEFVLLFAETSPSDAAALAEAIRADVEALHLISIATSVAVAIYLESAARQLDVPPDELRDRVRAMFGSLLTAVTTGAPVPEPPSA